MCAFFQKANRRRECQGEGNGPKPPDELQGVWDPEPPPCTVWPLPGAGGWEQVFTQEAATSEGIVCGHLKVASGTDVHGSQRGHVGAWGRRREKAGTGDAHDPPGKELITAERRAVSLVSQLQL